MEKFIEKIVKNAKIKIKNTEYIVKTKTWYSIEEDENTSYIKCELSNNKVLVIIPDDNLIFIGEVIENMNYQRISDEIIKYNDVIFNKTASGHQYITKIEIGLEDEVEGRCIFEDYEAENNVISLGILPDKSNERADVFAECLSLEDIEI